MQLFLAVSRPYSSPNDYRSRLRTTLAGNYCRHRDTSRKFLPKTAISLARPAKKSLGSHIQTARAEKGMSQRQLALVTGTSRSYLWRIESGTADVGIDVLCRISRALDVEVADLIDF